LSDTELLLVRARHLADGDAGNVGEVVAGLQQWRAAIEDQDHDELVLWYEHDLFDQLNLLQLLDWIRPTLTTRQPVSLICIGTFPGRPGFKGLGELTPAELAPLVETRQRVTHEQCALAGRAWLAFRDPSPRALEALLRSDTSALPFVAPALARHLEEYPWTGDGLSRTERRLLELARPAPVEIHAAYPRMHDRETAFYISGESYWRLLLHLSSSVPALVVLETRDADPDSLPRGTIALSDFGRAVLARTADRIRHTGIDRWLGGVHLTGSGPIWRWDSTGRCMVFE
jgi:hypothetical protein